MAGSRRRFPSRRWHCWAGPSAATYRSRSAGPRPTPLSFASTQRNWPRSPRRHYGWWHVNAGAAAASDHARSRSCSRSSSTRSAPATSTAWRGRAAMSLVSCNLRIQRQREMAGAAQRDRAGGDARGGSSGCHPSLWNRRVCRDPGLGADAQGGGQPGRFARRRRDRARCRGFAKTPNGGLILTGSAASVRHRALIVTLAARLQAARDLFRALLRRRRWPCPMGPITSRRSGKQPPTSTVSSKARSRPTCRCRRRRKYETVINLKTAKALGLDRSSVAARRAPTR